jgi:hypothetical protein
MVAEMGRGELPLWPPPRRVGCKAMVKLPHWGQPAVLCDHAMEYVEFHPLQGFIYRCPVHPYLPQGVGTCEHRFEQSDPGGRRPDGFGMVMDYAYEAHRAWGKDGRGSWAVVLLDADLNRQDLGLEVENDSPFGVECALLHHFQAVAGVGERG